MFIDLLGLSTAGCLLWWLCKREQAGARAADETTEAKCRRYLVLNPFFSGVEIPNED